MRRRLASAAALIAFVMWGCSGLATTPAPPKATSPLSPSTTASVAPTVTTTSPGYGSCYYVWATSDLPELSKRIDSELKVVNPDFSGSAYAYGEDCVQADGTRTFTAMETDFRVQLAVADLSDKESMGNWVARIMSVVLAVPASELQGPRPGRVEFEFATAQAESRRLNVDITTYKAQGAGLQGARLFDLLDGGQ
jgi:hypothetical protein